MATYRRVYDSRHSQADCKEPGTAPEPYAGQSIMGYRYLFYLYFHESNRKQHLRKKSSLKVLKETIHIALDEFRQSLLSSFFKTH